MLRKLKIENKVVETEIHKKLETLHENVSNYEIEICSANDISQSLHILEYIRADKCKNIESKGCCKP